MKLILHSVLLLSSIILILSLMKTSESSRSRVSRIDEVKKEGIKHIIKNALWTKKLVHFRIRTTPAPPKCLTQKIYVPIPYLTPFPDPNATRPPSKYPNRRCGSPTTSMTASPNTDCTPVSPRPYVPPCGNGIVYSVNYFKAVDYD